MYAYQHPGVYRQELLPRPAATLLTGVPAFLGFVSPQVSRDRLNVPQMVRLLPEFEQYFGAALRDRYLAGAVRGFFQNGGSPCFVVPLDDSLPLPIALTRGLTAVEGLTEVDLICVPDAIRPYPQRDLPPLNDFSPLWKAYVERRLNQEQQAPNPDEVLSLQAAILDYCDRLGDRFAILDSLPDASRSEVLEQRKHLNSNNGAFYYPWLQVAEPLALSPSWLPSSGHVAGVYARSDRQVGPHKAPANEVLEGVLDLEQKLTDAQQATFNPQGINCLRVFPGRGIRIWGARTLSREPAWTYVNTRRLFLTAGRWLERNLAGVTFEPHDPNLWGRIERDLNVYFNSLFRQGGLKGNTDREAFYVKCDRETNPPEVGERGKVITEIGLAPAIPSEFIVVYIIHGASGITITEPAQLG